MDSRKLLHDRKEPLIIHIDSESINAALDVSNCSAKKIISFSNFEDILWIRSEFETDNFPEEILEYKIKKEGEEIKGLKYENQKSKTQMAFGYKMKDIKHIAEVIYSKTNISEEELNDIIKVFTQAVFNNLNGDNIYLTENKLILKNRLWFESHFPGGTLNIMNLEELILFLDLFLKENKEYFIASHHSANKGYWYHLSSLEKIPLFKMNLSGEMIASIYNRFCYSLMALDEIGIQFHKGVNNDTMDNALYHFNYMLTLICGIFDNLALIADESLSINMPNKMFVSLNNHRSKKFLQEVRKKNSSLGSLIDQNRSFINLIHLLRDQIVHREGVQKTAYEMQDLDFKWKYNFLIIEKEVQMRLKELKDKQSENSVLSEWGNYLAHEDSYLEPWHFSLKTMSTLSAFVNKYLSLIGLDEKELVDKYNTLKIFQEKHLGY